MELQVQNAFPQPIGVAHVEGAAAINERLILSLDGYPELADPVGPDKWFCNVRTTFGHRKQVLGDPACEGLVPYLIAAVKAFTETLGWSSDGFEPAIFESWMNVYQDGGYQEIHQHPMSLVSGVYFAEAPPDSGSLFFQASNPSMFVAHTDAPSPYGATVVTFQPQPGMLVLFPSDLRHGVQPTPPGGRRVSLAFNVRQDNV